MGRTYLSVRLISFHEHNPENKATKFTTWAMRGCPLTLYTLTPVCKFSVLFFQIFLRVLSRRNCLTIRNVSSSQNFLYSNDFNFWFRGDTIRKKFDRLYYVGELRFTRLEIHCETLSIFLIETSNRNFESYFQLWQITPPTSAQGFMTSRTLDPWENIPPSLLNATIMIPERLQRLHLRILVKKCALIIVTEVEREILAVV